MEPLTPMAWVKPGAISPSPLIRVALVTVSFQVSCFSQTCTVATREAGLQADLQIVSIWWWGRT